MSKFIVLYNYNKYYNRIIKKLNTYAEYKALITPLGSTPAEYHGFELVSTNFNYQDGVFAKHVINTATMETFYQVEQPDYLVLEQEYKEGETIVKKVSRWFVLETTKTLGGQFELSLRRDLLADYFSEVTNAPVFIERGGLDIRDPMIFNRESFTYNQIKQKEYLLNQHRLSGKGKGWIVGYIAKEETPTAISDCTGQVPIPDVIPNYEDLPAWLKVMITNGKGYEYSSSNFTMNFVIAQSNAFSISVLGTEYQIANDSLYKFDGIRAPGRAMLVYNGWVPQNEIEHSISIAYGYQKSNLISKLNAWYSSLGLTDTCIYGSMEQYQNLVYKGSDNKYYRINWTRNGNVRYQIQDFTVSQVRTSFSDLANAYYQFVDYIISNNTGVSAYSGADLSADTVRFYKTEVEMNVTVTEVSYDQVKTTIPANRNKNIDAPYDIFCIPLEGVSVKSSGNTLFTQASGIAQAIGTGISVKGGTRIYDVQILPYCPFREMINSSGDIDITGFTEGKDYSYITTMDGATNLGIVLYPKSCRGTFDMEIPDTADVYSDCIEETDSAIEKKIKSETKLCRFVSPNFASTFEINVQKNKGITSLNVDYFYKPYTPYLHIAPYFNYMYGFDYNDPKGLICSGEFSIATAQSQWENYQIQNKNYELIFNRQIENLDVNNSIAMEQLKITSALGVATSGFTGAAAGAVAGGTAAGPWGAAAGAVVGAVGGAVSSAIGRKYDLEYLKKSQTEARGFAKDMYAYQLGNIKALPYSLTRVSAFTENNKVFPFIEFYDATDEEKEALRNKIKYNGMTVMRIGKISEHVFYDQRYVQGQLIRLEGIDEDSHVIAEIANEIKEGAYYYGTDTIEP